VEPVAIVGGGVFVAKLCEALARIATLPDLDLRLTARRDDRLSIIVEHVRRRLRAIRPAWRVRGEPFDAAVRGATVVIMLARIGGHAARAHDEAFPRLFGLVGDEGLGPGGIANAYRTVPELRRMADVIAGSASSPCVLNLMAPLGVTTRVLLDAGLDATGVCELPLLTLEAFALAAGVDARTVSFRYGGLNHLGWFWEVRTSRIDVLTSPDAGRHVDAATLSHYGAAPLHYYYGVFQPDIAARLGVERRCGRALELQALSDTIVTEFATKPGDHAVELDRRPTPWFDRAVAPMMAALLGGPPHRGFANVRNGTLISELPRDVVVEASAVVDRLGVHPVSPGPMPTAVAGFLRAVAESEHLAYAAGVTANPRLVVDAMHALPLAIAPRVARALSELACAQPR
jgi:6-phospho-beta-glucosidase